MRKLLLSILLLLCLGDDGWAGEAAATPDAATTPPAVAGDTAENPAAPSVPPAAPSPAPPAAAAPTAETPPPAAPTPSPASPPTALVPQGTFIGQAIPVKYAASAELKKVLQMLVTPGGAVLDQPGGKALMIVDTPEKTRRLVEIKELLDVPAFASARFDFYQPKTAVADELADGVNGLIRSRIIDTGASAIGLVPFPAGNLILIISQTEAASNEARSWIARLDRGGASARKIYIYPIETKDGGSTANKIAAWAAGKKSKSSNPGGSPKVTIDPATDSLIAYATPEEFREIRDTIDPGRSFAEFKQRLSSVEQMFESVSKAPSTTNLGPSF